MNTVLHEAHVDEVVAVVSAALADGYSLALVAAHDDVTCVRVVYVLVKGPPDHRIEVTVRLDPTSPAVPTLAGVSFSASRFEREMRDLFGVEPLGHPQPRRLVLHQHWPDDWFAMRANAGDAPPMLEEGDTYPFVPVEGDGVYEIPVGPVHAGLIEPGHFRFFVVGETILRMKARLWFVHKGIERLFHGMTCVEGLELAQRISGDSAVSHSVAYVLAVEEALGYEVSAQHAQDRGALVELERLYNHVTDLGALCNDVAFSVANARALTLRERLLRLNEQVTGHRLLRGGVYVGGARIRRRPTSDELTDLGAEFDDLVAMVRSNALVRDRFVGTAVLEHDDALEMGTLGVVARASGVECDARIEHPWTEPLGDFQTSTRTAGDVQARFDVRVDEVRTSLSWLRAWVGSGTSTIDEPSEATSIPGPGRGVGLVEGWRGRIAHRVEVDSDGRLTRVKVVDPSFFNWPALPVCLADTIIPDFPLANKSFNLSYAGNDL